MNVVHVDVVLQLAKDAQEDMLKLNQVSILKEGFGPPYIYIGTNADKLQLEDGRNVWSMTASNICVEL